MYDLLCTAVYPGLDSNLAMLFGSRLDRNLVNAKDLKTAGELLELKNYTGMCRGMADKIRRLLPATIENHAKRYGDCPIYGKIAQVVIPACDKILKMTAKNTPKLF